MDALQDFSCARAEPDLPLKLAVLCTDRTAQAQRFLTVHGIIGNLFRVGRQLLRAVHYRLFRARAFDSWQQVSCA
jgi:hypothetical protein